MMNRPSASSTSTGSNVADSASVRATSTVGTPRTSAANRAALSVLTNWDVGNEHLASEVSAFLLARELVLEGAMLAAPLSISDFMSSNVFKAPPNPASASATTGAIHDVPASPSAQAIRIRAPQRVAVILRTRVGTLLDGIERTDPIGLAGEVRVHATCHPET